MPDSDALLIITDSLNRIEEKVDRGLAGLQSTMATKADLAEIRGEMTGQAKRITNLERESDLRKAKAEVHRERDQRSWFSRANKWKVIGTIFGAACSLAIAAAAVVSLILQAH